MSLDAEVAALDGHIHAVLDAAYHRMGCAAPLHNGRPVVQMVHDAVEQLPEEELEIWMEAWRGFLAVLWAEGPSPEKALKRLVSLTWAVSREHLANMSQTDLGLLTHETKAAWCHRIKLVYSDYLRSRGFRGSRVPGQKSETATQIYARAARNNTSRKRGRKKGDEPTRRAR